MLASSDFGDGYCETLTFTNLLAGLEALIYRLAKFGEPKMLAQF
jgi:hypothetical protein